MERTHKIKLYPTKQQAQVLAGWAGAARFVYNWGLDRWTKEYEEYKAGKRDRAPNWVSLSREWTQNRPEWAKDIPRSIVAYALKNLNNAFLRVIKKTGGYPKFKKRGYCREAFWLKTEAIRGFNGKRIRLPYKMRIRTAEELRFQGKIQKYSIVHEAGDWFVLVSVSMGSPERILTGSTCGVDVGMKTPAVCSDDTKLVLPEVKLRKLEKTKRRHQRIVSRRKRSSNRRKKALLRVQKIQVKINNIRLDCIHKFTTSVCKNHDTVVIEDLNLTGLHQVPIKNIRSGMVRSCMYEIRRQLEYKAFHIVKADKWYPSTQLCSNCGSRQKLTLDQRIYKCPHCGLELDRDLNAAINLSHYPGSPG